MQRVDCQVRLSGKLTHTVGKKNISVAEIVALRAIHGADAVVDVQPKANDKTPHAAEMDHLRKTYGDKVILALLPGHSPRIPVSLKDVGLDREGKQIGDIPPVTVPADRNPADRKSTRLN